LYILLTIKVNLQNVDTMTVILFAIPLFVLLIAIEILVDKRKKTGHYRANDAIASLSMGVLSRVMAIRTELFTLGMDSCIHIVRLLLLLESPYGP